MGPLSGCGLRGLCGQGVAYEVFVVRVWPMGSFVVRMWPMGSLCGLWIVCGSYVGSRSILPAENMTASNLHSDRCPFL